MKFFFGEKSIKSLSSSNINNFLCHSFFDYDIVMEFRNKRLSFNSLSIVTIVIMRSTSLHGTSLKLDGSRNSFIMVLQFFKFWSGDFGIDQSGSSVFDIGHSSWFHFSLALSRVIEHPSLKTVSFTFGSRMCSRYTLTSLATPSAKGNIVANVAISSSSTKQMFFLMMILAGRH